MKIMELMAAELKQAQGGSYVIHQRDVTTTTTTVV